MSDHAYLTEYIVRSILLQEAFESRCSQLAEEEDCILAFINAFTLAEGNVMKMPSNMQMELDEFGTENDKLSSWPNTSELINCHVYILHN